MKFCKFSRRPCDTQRLRAWKIAPHKHSDTFTVDSVELSHHPWRSESSRESSKREHGEERKEKKLLEKSSQQRQQTSRRPRSLLSAHSRQNRKKAKLYNQTRKENFSGETGWTNGGKLIISSWGRIVWIWRERNRPNQSSIPNRQMNDMWWDSWNNKSSRWNYIQLPKMYQLTADFKTFSYVFLSIDFKMALHVIDTTSHAVELCWMESNERERERVGGIWWKFNFPSSESSFNSKYSKSFYTDVSFVSNFFGWNIWQVHRNAQSNSFHRSLCASSFTSHPRDIVVEWIMEIFFEEKFPLLHSRPHKVSEKFDSFIKYLMRNHRNYKCWTFPPNVFKWCDFLINFHLFKHRSGEKDDENATCDFRSCTKKNRVERKTFFSAEVGNLLK